MGFFVTIIVVVGQVLDQAQELVSRPVGRAGRHVKGERSIDLGGVSAVVRNTAQAVAEIARLRQPLIQGVQADEQVATALEA